MHGGASVSLSLAAFESTHYSHCQISHELSTGYSQGECFSRSLDCYPPWFHACPEVIHSHLDRLSLSTLYQCVSIIPGASLCPRLKSFFCDTIANNFVQMRASILAKSLPEVLEEFASVELQAWCDRHFLWLLCSFVEDMYGSDVAAVLRRPLPAVYTYHSVPDPLVPWSSLPTEDLVSCLRHVTLGALSDSLRGLPFSNRPAIHTRSHSKTLNGLISHIHAHVLYLQLAGFPVLCDVWLTYSTYTWLLPSDALDLITHILEFEYGSTVVQALFCEPMSLSQRCKVARCEEKQLQVSTSAALVIEHRNQWPSLVPRQTVLECQAVYCKGSLWVEPPICTVCAQCQDDCQTFCLSKDVASDLHLESLRLTDLFIIQKCILQGLSTRFTFGSLLIDGLMLEKAGVKSVNTHMVSLNVCGSCCSVLRKPDKVPHLALRNHLFRGNLPVQFHDLT
jgi:hypothetical protein